MAKVRQARIFSRTKYGIPDSAYAILERMKRAQDRGFTIAEVMVVLAVTGALFISAALLVSGQQRQTEFDQSIRQIQTQLQEVVNQVASGFYPDTEDFICTAGLSEPNLIAGTSQQGTNSGCVFLGKVVQMQVHDSDPETFAVHSIIGLKKKPGTDQEAQTLAEAGARTLPQALTTKQLEHGLTTGWMRFNGANIGAVGFISSLAQYNTDGSIISGSQQVGLMPMEGTALNQTTGAAVGLIKTALRDATPPDPSPGVKICFVSGGTNQSGLITLGSSGRQLSVTLDIKENKTCA